MIDTASESLEKIFRVLGNKGVFEIFEVLIQKNALRTDSNDNKARYIDLMKISNVDSNVIRTNIPKLEEAKIVWKDKISKKEVYYSLYDEKAMEIIKKLIEIKNLIESRE